MTKRSRALFESAMQRALFLCAAVSVLSVVFITAFIILQGVPIFRVVRIGDFLFGTNWQPTASPPHYGILSFVVGSVLVTAVGLLIGVPIGLAGGIFLAEIASSAIARVLRPMVELLAGIPSVVYGFFGAVFISRMVRDLFGGTGYSVLAAALILAIMTLPTIITITEVSFRGVSHEYREASFAIGATRTQTILHALLPAARPGIIAGIVLAIGRAMGETMAVLMVGGNAPIMPTGLLSKVRTLTMNIVTDMGYASGDHLTALFATGMVLFIVIMAVNAGVMLVTRRTLAHGR